MIVLCAVDLFCLTFNIQIAFVAGTGEGLRVSKLRRISQPDDKLASGIDYTYVADKSKFATDNATLRFDLVTLHSLCNESL